jgi:acyl-coenzyme A thioesterase PaaI-like protein
MADSDDVVSDPRTSVARVLRQLGHAIVAHHVDEDVLERIGGFLGGVVAEVEAGRIRGRDITHVRRTMFAGTPADGRAMQHFPDCIVSGKANPMGIAIQVVRDGDEAVATVALGAAFEGAPGRAHGGIVAAIFDDVMGYVLSIHQTPAYTARLTIVYRAPVPLKANLEFRSRLVARDGRKLRLTAEAWHAGTVIADAEALFIGISPERFGGATS